MTLRGLAPLAVVLFCAAARAAVPVQLDLDERLGQTISNKVRELVALDLRTVEAPDPGVVTAVRVRLHEGETLVRIEVDDPVTGKSLVRTVDYLALGAKGAPRLLAAAIVELLSASWAELATNPKPVAEPVGPRASPEVQRDALALVESRAEVQLSALGAAHALFAGTGPLYGAGLRVVPALAGAWVLPLELAVARAVRDFALGDVEVGAVGAMAGLAYERRGEALGGRVALGVRGGAVRYRGAPRSREVEGGSVWAPWMSPVVAVSGLVMPLEVPLMLELVVEAGYALTPTSARVAQTRELSLSGPWLGAALAVGVWQ